MRLLTTEQLEALTPEERMEYLDWLADARTQHADTFNEDEGDE